METKIQKWGNSLAVRLPKEMSKNLSLQTGSVVILTHDKKRIIIEYPKRSISLQKLLKRIKKDNLHNEIEWGKNSEPLETGPFHKF